MEHLKKSFALSMLLTVIIGSRTYAQEYFDLAQILNVVRAQAVMQSNEYQATGYEEGTFFCNPLMLDGKPLDYNLFSLKSKGILTVVKGAAKTGQSMQVPFHAYLRRCGKIVNVPGMEKPDPTHLDIDLSDISKHAKPGDQLVIESVRKEDGSVKRILKLVDGC